MKPRGSLALLRQRFRVWKDGVIQEAAGYALRKAGAITIKGSLQAVLTLGHLDEQAELQARIDFAEQGKSEKWISRFLAWHKEHEGERIDYGVVSRQVVTDIGVAFLADDWFDASKEITNMNFHDSGTGSVAENQTDIDLGTPAGPTTRATGTKSNAVANVVVSVGTITYTGTLAITEHGLFSTASRATDDLWDRSVFTAINVVNTDSIEFTYSATLPANG
ncbi:MAG: hypothetical protein V3U45_03030 [bacterium]